MKTTLEIPDELYRQAKVQAARGKPENERPGERRVAVGAGADERKLDPASAPNDEGTCDDSPEGNVIPPLSNDAMAELLASSGQRLP